MKQQGSNFATIAGLVLLTAALLTAAYFQRPGLVAFLGAGLFLCLFARLWGSLALRRLELTAEETVLCGFPGETLHFHAALRNRKALPVLWLEVDPDIPETGPIGPVPPDESLAHTLLWIMPGQELRWTQSVLAVRRGVYRGDHIRMTAGDGFGLSSCSARGACAGGLRVVVYPALVPVDCTPVLKILRSPEAASSGLYADPTLIRTVRPYQAGDSARDINWRLLAQQQGLQVNVRERQTPRRVCFIPDLSSYTYQEPDPKDGSVMLTRIRKEDLEQDLSLIASLIESLARRDIFCALAIPGLSAGGGRLFLPDSAHPQVGPLLTALAEIEHISPGMHAPASMETARHLLGPVFVFSYDTGHLAGEIRKRLPDAPVCLVTGQLPDDRSHVLDREVLLCR